MSFLHEFDERANFPILKERFQLKNKQINMQFLAHDAISKKRKDFHFSSLKLVFHNAFCTLFFAHTHSAAVHVIDDDELEKREEEENFHMLICGYKKH